MSSTTNFSAIATSSTHPDDAQLVIREVTKGIVTFSRPFSRGGILAVGGRSTAIQLPNNEVFVYASTPLSPATKEALDTLGDVKYLVTPDGEHAMFIKEYTDAYPAAKAIGVQRLKDSKPEIKWAGLFGLGGESIKYGFEPTISLHNVPSHLNDELIAIHHPTGTLIEADILFNLPPTEQYSRAGGLPILAKLIDGGSTMSPEGWFHGVAAKGLVRNSASFTNELKSIHAAKWDRVIPCHGDVIETGGRAAWDKIWAKYA